MRTFIALNQGTSGRRDVKSDELAFYHVVPRGSLWPGETYVSVSNEGDLAPALNTIPVCTYEEGTSLWNPTTSPLSPTAPMMPRWHPPWAMNQIKLSLWAQPNSRWPTYSYRAPLKNNGTRLWIKPHHLQPHLPREFSRTRHLDGSS